MKRVIILGASLLALCVGIPALRTHATSYMAPDNIDELIQRSSLIVIGKTPKSLTEGKAVLPRTKDGTIHGVYTEVPFKISKTFKGNKNLKQITIAEAAAVVRPGNGKPAYIQG